ncbi:MAG: STAS domain-containing protein [Candidatus Omnitrophota bacterium]|nr:STAS domain-containing protein [Candidatus Omnitrophota bacterium]
MKIRFDKKGDGCDHVMLSEDLDYQGSSEMRAQLTRLVDDKAQKILLDFQGVPYIDSSGIAVFVEFYQKIKSHGGKLVFYNLSDAVRNIFELAKLQLFFSIVGSEEEALTELASH